MLETLLSQEITPAADDLPVETPTTQEESPTLHDRDETPPAVELPEDEPTPPQRIARQRDPVLTIESGTELESEAAIEEAAWHEIHNAYRTRRILSGMLSGIEQTESGRTIAIVDHNGFRIVIPVKEMMVLPGEGNAQTGDRALRQNKLLGNMLGAEIDFVIRGIEAKTRSVVASRRDAMLRKRQMFYFPVNGNPPRIYEGRTVQARVIAVATKSVRMEVFGVECSVLARDLAWDWIGDAHDRYAVGDEVLARIASVQGETPETLCVQLDVKSVTPDTSRAALAKCRLQCKYMAQVTDIHKGVVYLRLSNGANAVAHSCYDTRSPGKRDEVSFVVTKIDDDRGLAVGLITRIIRQHL